MSKDELVGSLWRCKCVAQGEVLEARIIRRQWGITGIHHSTEPIIVLSNGEEWAIEMFLDNWQSVKSILGESALLGAAFVGQVGG